MIEDVENNADEEYVPEAEDDEERNEEAEEQKDEIVVEKQIISRTPKRNVQKKTVITAKNETKKVTGSVELLCNDFVKLSNSLKSSIKKKAVFKKVIYTVLKDKCADHHLQKSTVDKMIELLKSDQDTQEIHFKLEKNTLFKDYFNYAFTQNQQKVIDDLANMEVTNENIEQQLVFATYYAKNAKLMLKYALASTDRSKESVKDVVDALNHLTYTDAGYVSPLSWYETVFVQPRDALCGTLSLVAIASIALKWGDNTYLIIGSMTLLASIGGWFAPNEVSTRKFMIIIVVLSSFVAFYLLYRNMAIIVTVIFAGVLVFGIGILALVSENSEVVSNLFRN